MADGDRWKEQRRFAMQTLKDLGVGRTGIESRIKIEADRLVEEFEEKIGDRQFLTLDIIEPIKSTIANIIFSVLFGWTYPRGDPELKKDCRNSEICNPFYFISLSFALFSKLTLA